LKKIQTYSEIKKRLQEADLKITPQRVAVLEALNNLNHPSVEAIFDFIQTKQPGISLGTVYKTLESFENKGLAGKVLSEEGTFRYDWNTGEHNHIYCTNTMEIVDFEDSELQEMLEVYFKKKKLKNIRIQNIRLQINVEKVEPEKEISIE